MLWEDVYGIINIRNNIQRGQVMDGVHDFIGDLIDQKMIIDIEPDVRESLIEDLSELLMREINIASIIILRED